MVLEELQRRNYSQKTTKIYIRTIWEFAKYFNRSPEELGPEQIREFQAQLFSKRKLAAQTVAQRTAALRFLFVKTLKRPYMLEHIPYPKIPLRLPTILSQEEVTRLIDSAPNLLYRTILMTLYSTGMRRAELVQLKAADIDKELMLVHIREGKGKRDRNVPISPKLLEALREYWRWMRPVTYEFHGVVECGRAARRHYQARSSSSPAPQLCHAPAGRRRRPPQHPSAARSRGHPGHDHLSAPVPEAPASRCQSARRNPGLVFGHCARQGQASPAMSRPPVEVADIIRAWGDRFFESNWRWLHWSHVKALNAIERCRTAALGGHRDQCPQCGHQAISYNSCRNRHCPKCQTAARNRWVAERQAEVLPVGYFHVVFTLPHELCALALRNKKELYRLLFRASSETLLDVAANPKT